MPLFDGGFTAAAGIEGQLGGLGNDAAIAFTEMAANGAEAGALGEARRSGRHNAIVAITRRGRPGFCPSNADRFMRPFGPPVLQVTAEEAVFLAAGARRARRRC